MPSHKKIGAGLWLTAPHGTRFKKRASGYNRCIGESLKGGKGPVNGGRYDKGWQQEFTRAVKGCAGKRVSKVV
jgi:hypothetical protein